MTERQKEKILLYMVIRKIVEKKYENKIDIETLEYIQKLKNNVNFEKYDKMYKKSVKVYRKAKKDE